MGTVKEVETLIYALRERPHVAEFAYGCAKRAKGYAHAAYARHAAAARYALDAADYAAEYATYALDYAPDYASYATYAAEAADDASYAASDYVSATERDLQITHLKELHVREESSNNTLGNTV